MGDYTSAYMYAVAAGANPMEAGLLAAIAGPESGYNSNAFNGNSRTGDQSYGLWQINMLGSMGPARRAQFGIQSNDQLFDPVTNARAALAILHSQGPGAWTAYKSGAYKQYMQGAPVVDQGFGGGGGGGGGAPAAAQPTQNFRVPGGGTVTTVNGGYPMVIYNVGPGVNIYFALDSPSVQTGGLPRQNLSSGQWAGIAGQMVAGGSASELNSIAQDYGDFGAFWSHLLDTHLGPNAEARNDPGVIKVMAQLAARPDMSTEELQNLLRNTDYWKNRTAGQNAWNDYSPAEQQKRLDDMKSQLADQWFQLTGQQFNFWDPNLSAQLLWWSTLVATGQKDINQAVFYWIKPVAGQNPESPWSRTVRTEQENERQRGVDIENSTQSVRAQAHKWGVPMADAALSQWGSDLVTKKSSDADLTTFLSNAAHMMYPWMEKLDPTRQQDTETLAQPWLQTYSRVMEQPPDIMAPPIQEALASGKPAWQFEHDLKMRPDWLQTKNAQDTINGALSEAGGKMGFE